MLLISNFYGIFQLECEILQWKLLSLIYICWSSTGESLDPDNVLDQSSESLEFGGQFGELTNFRVDWHADDFVYLRHFVQAKIWSELHWGLISYLLLDQVSIQIKSLVGALLDQVRVAASTNELVDQLKQLTISDRTQKRIQQLVLIELVEANSNIQNPDFQKCIPRSLFGSVCTQ